MYKVFLNDRLIRIEHRDKLANDNPVVAFDSSVQKQDVKDWFNFFTKGDINEVLLLHPNPRLFFKVFQSAFNIIRAAGGVVRAENHVLFIYRRGKWDLPKGKIDKGETPSGAAIREVAEECGITGHEIVRKLPSTFHIYPVYQTKSRLEWIFKETIWYEMKYQGKLAGTPQTEEDITMVKWIPENEIAMVLSNTFENLKQIIRLYCV